MKIKIIPISLIVLFSIFLWISVTLSGEFITTIQVPVKLTDLPQNYTTGTISEEKIYLRIKSKGWEIFKLNLTSDIEFYVSAHRKVGKYRVDLRDEIKHNAWLSNIYQVIDVAPSIIEYQTDKIVTKNVIVGNNIVGNILQGYGITSEIQITPPTIEISGPNSVISKIDTIFTSQKVFTNLNENFNAEIDLEIPEGVKSKTRICKIEFEIQKIVEKSFENIPIEIRNVPPSKELVLYPSKINVVIKGGINKIGRITTDSIYSYIDFWTVIREDKELIEPVIVIPNNTSLVDVKPKKIEYVIKQY